MARSPVVFAGRRWPGSENAGRVPVSYRYDLHGNRDHLDEQDDTEKRSSRVTLRVYAQVKVLLTAPKPISPRLDPGSAGTIGEGRRRVCTPRRNDGRAGDRGARAPTRNGCRLVRRRAHDALRPATLPCRGRTPGAGFFRRATGTSDFTHAVSGVRRPGRPDVDATGG